MPAKSEKQRRAAQAAVHGKSTLGISPAVGRKILGKHGNVGRKKKNGSRAKKRR